MAIQFWLRDKPKWRFLGLIAYAVTLAILLSAALVTVVWIKDCRLSEPPLG